MTEIQFFDGEVVPFNEAGDPLVFETEDLLLCADCATKYMHTEVLPLRGRPVHSGSIACQACPERILSLEAADADAETCNGEDDLYFSPTGRLQGWDPSNDDCEISSDQTEGDGEVDLEEEDREEEVERADLVAAGQQHRGTGELLQGSPPVPCGRDRWFSERALPSAVAAIHWRYKK